MPYMVPEHLGLRRVAATACVAACLMGQTGTLPHTLAFGAWLERSHTVQVAQANGRLTVVLSHQRGSPLRPDYTPRHQAGNPRHRHGPAARILCCFAFSAASRADHTASFASGTICESAPGIIKVPAGRSNARAIVLPSGAFSRALDVRESLSGSSRISADLRPSDSLRLLRSTVLVI